MQTDSPWTLALAVFNAVFLAGLGGMAQLATALYAGEAPGARAVVFLAAAVAAVLLAALAVFAGAWIVARVPGGVFHAVSGAVFVMLGLWQIRVAAFG